MKCKNCGSSLDYSGGVYMCESCGRKYTVADFYENIDTYICYIENDENGRRTKDSIIAQDIYQKLESNKIRTFYGRISADGLIGGELEQMCNAAIHVSKTIIVLGTQRRYFEALLERYSAYFEGKTVIPVYADMDAYAIPKGISAIQALDYNRVGATVDLTKSLLNALGREKEVDFIMLSERTISRKRIVWIVVLIVAILLGALIFSVTYMENKNINNKNQENVLSPEEMQSSKYNEALSCVEEGDFVKAIKMFSSLGDYQDSQKQLLLLYEKYAGYYKDDRQNITFRLQIWEGNTAGIEVIAITESGAQCSISETSQFKENELELEFNDSENNTGNIIIELTNTEVVISVKTLNPVSGVMMGDFECKLLLSEKTDKPFAATLDAKTLLSFVESRTTLSQLKQMGLEVEFEAPLYKDQEAGLYRIKNTEITLAIYMYDFTKYNEEQHKFITDIKVKDPIVFGVAAPAEILVPNKIGKTNDIFLENDILYVPDGELCQYGHELDLIDVGNIKTGITTNSTNVCITSRTLLGDELFEELKESYLVHGRVAQLYKEQNSVTSVSVDITDAKDYYMVYASDYFNVAPDATYKVYKSDYSIEKIEQ